MQGEKQFDSFIPCTLEQQQNGGSGEGMHHEHLTLIYLLQFLA
jgi:hypothetical protein